MTTFPMMTEAMGMFHSQIQTLFRYRWTMSEKKKVLLQKIINDAVLSCGLVESGITVTNPKLLFSDILLLIFFK